jgi:aldose 1-epimerase
MTGDVVVLHLDDVVATVVPRAGGRLGSLAVGGEELLITGKAGDDPMQWGCFPMVPWAGRVRHGRFAFGGRAHQLPLDLPPHAIHGTGYRRPWTVDAATERTVALRIDLGPDWPLGGWATSQLALDPGGLTWALAVHAAGQAMPAQVGWHPWFRKPTSVDLRFAEVLPRDADHIATLPPEPPGPPPWDDCFRGPIVPPRLAVEGIAVTVESDCDHWVVYDEPPHATCVEPQSGPPDGFTLRPDVVPAGGMLARWMRIGWS